MIPKGHERWIERIREYGDMESKTDREIIIYALSYTLQSLRYNEDMNRFKWNKEGDKNDRIS